MSNDVTAQIETLRAEFNDLSKSITTLLQQKSSALNGAVHSVADSVMAQSGEALGRAADATRDASSRALDGLSAEMRRNPVQTLALAVAAGALLGLMSRSR